MFPILFSIGPVTIYTFGFLLGTGFFLASFLIWRRLRELGQQEEKIIKIAKIVKDSKSVYTIGNGGSAATASHFANDLQKMCSLKAYCLIDNTPLLTAWSNDFGYALAIQKQLETLADKGDTLVVISGSGDSDNIVLASHIAENMELNIIGFVGMNGGRIKERYEKTTIHIESDMLHSEDWHLTLCHIITKIIKEEK